jgi:hypothetical protein
MSLGQETFHYHKGTRRHKMATTVATKTTTQGTRGKKASKAPTKGASPAAEMLQDVCAECGKLFGERQPRSKNEAGQPIHIHHRITAGSTAPTDAKANRPCRMCLHEVEAGLREREKVNRDTYYTVGTRRVDEARKQVMVNTYLCQPHLSTIEWHSGPKFVGRSPEPEPTKKATRKPKTKTQAR